MDRFDPLPAAVLCPRRDGKPHQGAAEFVCRSHEHGGSTLQSAATLSLVHGLPTAACPTAIRTAGYRVGRSPSAHHPAATAEDCCSGTDYSSTCLDPLQFQLSLGASLPHRLVGAALLKPIRTQQSWMPLSGLRSACPYATDRRLSTG